MNYSINGKEFHIFERKKIKNGTTINGCTFCKASIKERKTRFLLAYEGECNQKVAFACDNCMKVFKRL